MAVTKPYVSTRKRVKAAAEAKKPVSPIVVKKRGRPAGVKNKPKPVDWEVLAKKLQRALAAEIKHNDGLEYEISVLRQHIDNLENRPWLSRMFNLKG